MLYEVITNVDQIEDQIIISPLMKLPIQENPFKQKERDYSIDFIYPYIKGYQATIKLPEGYKVESLPLEFTRDNKNIAFSYRIMKQDDNTLIISSNYQIKKPIYPAFV